MMGGDVFLVHRVNSSRKMVGLSDVVVVRQYSEVFLDELPGLRPPCDVDL